MLLACAAPAAAHLERKPEHHYRYVDPPRGEPRTPAPLSAQATVGPRAATSLVTGEPLAQAVLYVPPGGFGGATVTVRLEPRGPGGSGLRTSEPFAEVEGGTIIGNVYRLSADAPLRSGLNGAEIRLRPPFAVAEDPVVAHLVDGEWQALATRPISGGVFAGAIAATGDYALIVDPGEDADSGVSSLVPALVPLALLAAAGLGLGLRRRLRGSAE